MIRRLPPRFVEKVWGADSLAPLFPDYSNGRVGEVWFTEPGDPLLIKFLFTTEKLSVQVHPDDVYSAAHPETGAQGKTEMWHILAAQPGAAIAAGFLQEITPERLQESARSGEIEQLLEWHAAAPGDTFFIPAGTVHAIGAGLVLCEIQQNSDTTYRLYDYGRPRELHLEESAQVADLGPQAVRRYAQGNLLVRCPYFTTQRYEIQGTLALPPADRAQSLIVIAGQGELNGQPVCCGEVWRIDAAESCQASGQMAFLQVTAG